MISLTISADTVEDEIREFNEIFSRSGSRSIYDDVAQLQIDVSNLKAATADSGWLTLPLSEGIVAYNEANSPQYRKIGKLVIIRGTVKGITARNTVIGNLPNGYRPTKANPYVQNTSLGSGNVATQTRVTVTTTGDIKLEAISSDAVFGADKWFPIATMFLID